MVTIKDFLGALAVGINQSRVLADLESANIAREYAADEILKHFSVPRFRMDDVTLHIPMAIDQLGKKLANDQSPLDQEKIEQLVFRTFQELAPVDKMDERHKIALERYLQLQLELLETDLSEGRDKETALRFFVSSLVSELMIILSVQEKEEVFPKATELKEKLAETLMTRLNQVVKDPVEVIDLEQTRVIVEAAKLKEIRPENLIRASVQLVEESLILQRIEGNDGEIRFKLLPE
ncbi:hypothetical protein [Flavilitoribacter nigricans]|uniref:Uncharacterized protein n=1 Tax=Flavilitoribacter nigricans (strain ATCC 23147 / DSM 23189 / NBRC 102662 / NCIMB 1420 / SS-2) TaxID=1122177 RepID=A0A2D0NH48_FLAN2|nr:hypothetical protein [Flavilitoribacter nigricans]PHN07807.1 hypothetical protein CRP01_04610 [Flavilitoribacter nigricans DSM 23189 = NBRC 102662]